MPQTLLDRFDEYLKTTARIPPRHRYHYRSWVARFNRQWPDVKPGERQAAMSEFRMELQGRHEEWKVNQALQAVRHFWYFTDGGRIAQVGPVSEQTEAVLTDLRRTLRLHHKAYRTEQAYMGWGRRFLTDLSPVLPSEVTADHVRHFLSYLAVERQVSVSTQTQAFNALLFLCRYVLKIQIDGLATTLRSRRPRRLPTVLTPGEVKRILSKLVGQNRLIGALLYGCGLRLNECLSLRTQDIDPNAGVVMIRSGKGGKDRQTMYPATMREGMARHLEAMDRRRVRDQSRGFPGVWIPPAVANRISKASLDPDWYWVFPSRKPSIDPRSGARVLYHLHPSTFGRALSRATAEAGVRKRVTAHTFRHSFATHLIESGCDIRVVQELLGHSRIQTTMIYTHVANNRVTSVESPLDLL